LPATDAPADLIRRNLSAKLGSLMFRSDVQPLVREMPPTYTVEAATGLVEREVLSHL
jgi:hypothetical protein